MAKGFCKWFFFVIVIFLVNIVFVFVVLISGHERLNCTTTPGSKGLQAFKARQLYYYKIS